MTKSGMPRSDPVILGEVANPPFARLPDPLQLFRHRSDRFRQIAGKHALGPYLLFLGGLAAVQHDIQDGLPAPSLPEPEAIERARSFGMPPLDRGRFEPDAAFLATFDRILAGAAGLDMPEAARAALRAATEADETERDAMVASVLADSIPVEALAEYAFVAAALQVHFARLAARLDGARLVPVGEGACPACGGPPVSSLLVGWEGAHGTRFAACALCGTLWHVVRVRCTFCGSTKGIAYKEVEGGPGTVKAETCDACGSYLKILNQIIDPALDPIADDVASLVLDMLLRDTGFRRGGFNPYLLGY